VDITGEIRERLLDSPMLERGHVDLAVLVQTITASLAEDYPEEWAAWTLLAAESEARKILREAIRATRRSSIARERSEERRDSVLDALTGSPGDGLYAVPGNGWARLKDMVRPELLLVADQREGLARGNLAEALYLRALAERLPDDTTTVADIVETPELISLHEEAVQKAEATS
jgi:hypothetical protein